MGYILGVADNEDNCIEDANADQRDSNGDGFGHLCDADLDDNCVVDAQDWLLMREALGSGDGDADLDGSGIVDVVDARVLFGSRFEAPGPGGNTDECQ